MADDFLLEYSDLIHDDGTFEELSANIKQAKAELIDLAKVLKATKTAPGDVTGIEKREKAIKEVEATQKKLIKTEKALQVARKKTIELTNEELIQIQKVKAAQRERIQVAKQQAIIQNKESGQIEKLRAQLALTTIQWKKLSKEELNNGKKGKSLIATKRKLTDQLKKLEKQTGDTRRNVGNYSDSLSKLGKVAARVFVGRTIVDGLRSISTGVLNLIKDNRDADASIDELGRSFDSTGTSLKNAALSLLKFFAPALIAVANGIKFVVDLFADARVGSREFTATSGELTEKTTQLKEAFAKESAELAKVFSRISETNEGSKERKDLIDKLNSSYGKYLPNLLTEKSTLAEIGAAQRILNQQLTQKFLLQLKDATLTDVLTNKIKKQQEVFEALQKSAKGALSGNESQFNQLIESLNDVGSAGDQAFKQIQRNIFTFERFNDKLAESNPKLASFIDSIRHLDDNVRDRLIESIEIAARTSSDYNEVISETNDTINDIAGSMTEYDHAVVSSTKSLKSNTDAQIQNSQARIDAIDAVEKLLEKAEIDNIKDKQERLLELEEARFREVQKLKELQFIKDSVLLEGHEEELFQLQKANDKLGEEQEVDHLNKLADIKAQFNKQEIDIVSIDVRADALEDEAALLNEEVALVEEANEKILKSNDKLLEGIKKSAQKIGAVIVDLFKKQADLSKDSVDEQEGNLSRARDRAAKGLTANLAFEEQELSKRQLEQQQRQKEAETAAKILTLIAGFEEGGFTGKGGVSDIAGVVHGREYVVTAEDTAKYGLIGKGGGEFGEAMSDYYQPQSPVQQMPYQAQRKDFEATVKAKVESTSNDAVVKELRALNSHLAKQPNIGIAIEEVYENVYRMIKTESKQTVSKITKKVLRMNKLFMKKMLFSYSEHLSLKEKIDRKNLKLNPVPNRVGG